MRYCAAFAMFVLSACTLAGPAQAHERVWLVDYPTFVAVAHADYQAFILERGAWRIATGHIVRQGSRRVRVTHRRVRAWR